MITIIDRICEHCGIHFSTPAWRIKQGKGKFCSVACRNAFRKDKPSPTSPEKLSLAQKASYQRNPRRAINNSKIMKQLWQDPDYKAKISEQFKKLWASPGFRAKMSKIHKQQWQDPKYRTKVVASIIRGLKRKPTKPEQRLIDILSKHSPQFKYNGDFRLGVTLAGHIPDFVNVNGKKEVIEVFGDYFHSPEVLGDRWQGSELGKVMLYNSLGYKCLILWESELNKLSEDEIMEKVASFFRIK